MEIKCTVEELKKLLKKEEQTECKSECSIKPRSTENSKKCISGKELGELPIICNCSLTRMLDSYRSDKHIQEELNSY